MDSKKARGTTTLVAMTLNIDGFRSKREDLVNMIERFEARSGRKLSVIGLCETKLGDAEAPDVPGFRVVRLG